MNNHPRIIFYKITDNQSKIDLICAKVKESLEQEKRLLILVATKEAGEYLDALLWKKPAESFYPHIFTQESTTEWIAITQQLANINQASSLLNLGTLPVIFFQEFKEIYEIDDQTSPEKAGRSKERFDHYQSRGIVSIRQEF